MNILSKLNSLAIYKKTLAFFIILCVLTVTLISSTLYITFSMSAIDDISKISEDMLAQTSYSSTVLYDQVYAIASQLISDHKMVSALYTNELDYVQKYHVALELSKIKAVHPFIHSIVLYNDNANIYFTDRGSLFDARLNEIADEYSLTFQYSFQAKNVSRSTFLYPQSILQDQVLSFSLIPNVAFSYPQMSSLTINVDNEYLHRMVDSIHNNPDDDVFIIDNQGIIISHVNSKNFLSDFSTYEHIQKVMHSNEQNGYFTMEVSGENHLITYVKSKELGWTFISMRPRRLMISNIQSLRNQTIFLTIMISLLGIIFSVYIAKHLYSPLRKLIDKINTDNLLGYANKSNEYDYLSKVFSSTLNKTNLLENSLEITYPILKQTYLHYLVEGTHGSITKTVNSINNIESEFVGPYYCVIHIQIDNYQFFINENNKKDQNLVKFSIRNISQEILGDHFQNDNIDFGDNQIVTIIQLKPDIIPEEVYSCIKKIQHYINKFFNITITFSIGSIVSSPDDISNSYSDALKYSKYRLFLNGSSIITLNDIEQQIDNTVPYPLSIKNNIVDAIRLNKKENLSDNIKIFIEYISKSNYNHFIICINQLVIETSKLVDDISNGESNNYYNTIGTIEKLETIDDIFHCIFEHCMKLARTIDDMKNKQNVKLVNNIKEFIHDHYQIPDLSIDYMVDMVHLSPGYIGKIFRTVSDTSFTDYVNNIRMEKARELLATSNLQASAISKKVGFSSNTYFSTLFRKKYGMTPSQYRKNFSQPKQLGSDET